MNARKITFRNVGIVKRSRVWLNSETGVEIIKGANFAEVGLYYVTTPSQGRDNRSIFAAVKTFVEARTRATALVERFRAVIAKDHDEALEENLKRFAAGGPRCSKRCGALPGEVIARGHDVDCPRRAYAAAGPFSIWWNAERLIGNAHEDALREDGERFPLHVDHGTGVKIVRTLGIHGMPVLRVMRPVRDGFRIAASRDVNDEAGAVTAAARVIAEQWEYIAGAQLAAIDEDARRTAQQLAAA